jgi:hypothetical protein
MVFMRCMIGHSAGTGKLREPKLRFACPAVAEEQNLDLRVDLLSRLQVLVVGTDFIQHVFIVGLATDF